MRLKFLIFILCFSNIVNAQQKDFINYVNPLSVTVSDTTVKDSLIKQEKETNGLANVIPAVGIPFGMTQWTPQTQTSEEKDLAPYLYKNEKINGFRGTHWSKGYGKDYGSFTIMPISGNLRTNAQDYASAYSHENEISAPNYYKVLLDDLQITAEITGLARSGMMRFTAGKTDDFYLLITPNSDKDKGFVEINKSKNEVVGYNPVYQMTGKPAGFSGYFVVQFEKKQTHAGVYHGSQQLKEWSITNKKDLGAFLKFDLKKGESLTIKIGTSFTSIDNARENLASEIRTWDFEVIRKDAGRIWNNALGQINVETDSTKYKNSFYTLLYRTMQQPRLFNDVNGTYPKFSDDSEHGTNSGANYYDDFLLDDIYSSQLPLVELLQPRTAIEFANSIVLKGEESNWLPIFPGWSGDTKTMVGDHASVFLASVYAKKLYGIAYKKAYDLMRKNAFQSPNAQEYKDGKGRRFLRDYIKYGYIPRVNATQDTSYSTEHLEQTLAYAYADYAVATMAKRMNNFMDYQLLAKRTKNYVNVYDSTLNHPNIINEELNVRTEIGQDSGTVVGTKPPLTPLSFDVPHDVKGLAKLMGGRDSLESALDSLFVKDEYLGYDKPGHQIPFLYNYTNAPHKTQLVVNKIRKEYTSEVTGLSSDAVQSAWFVFAALGFYPLDPVSNQYILTTPMFKEANIRIANRKWISLSVIGNPETDIYIQSVKLNGNNYNKGFITYQQLMNGAEIEFTLGPEPNLDWASAEENQPISGLD